MVLKPFCQPIKIILVKITFSNLVVILSVRCPRQSVSGIVFLEATLKSVENSVFTQKPLCLVMNNPFNNFWQYGE